MPEYIERESAIEALMNDAPEQVGYYREDAADCIRYIDSADVAPVVHGRWAKNYDGDNIVYCDQCYMPQDMPTPYCHSCGAKMDGGAE